jgi:hypothetical protein
MSDIRQTRREKICAHLLDVGGESTLADLHEWSALKLLCTHAPFSELMEGMVEDGLLRWDGTIFSLHSEGRALGESTRAAATAKKGKRKKSDAASDGEAAATPDPLAEPVVEIAAVAEPVAEPVVEIAAVAEPVAEPVAAQVIPAPPVEPVVAADQAAGHSHSHGHDHGHDHGHRDDAGAARPEPTAHARAPRPAPPEPPRGLLSRAKARIKRLLGR